MTRPTFAELVDPAGTGYLNNRIMAVIASGQNPDGTPWDGLPVLAANGMEQRAKDGIFYRGSSGALTAGVAGNLVATITNPAGSGVRLYVTRFLAVQNSGPLLHARLWINPTTGLPTTAKAISNSLVGGPASVAAIKADIAAAGLGGGTNSGIDIPVGPAGQPLVNDLTAPIIVPAGVTMGVDFMGLALNSVASVTLGWWEE